MAYCGRVNQQAAGPGLQRSISRSASGTARHLIVGDCSALLVTSVSMNDELSAQAATYFKELDRFVRLCAELTATGKPYVTVLLCHELYRFLYPAEPYLGFKHDDPVPFLVQHIRNLSAFGAAAREAVCGYPDPTASDKAPPTGSQVAVEKQTSDLYSDL